MNRKIKFRMPITESGKFTEWFYWGFCGNTEGEFISPHNKYRKHPSFEYTGLKDKNGIEIYEGDILQYKHYRANIKWWSTVKEIPEINARTEDQRQNFHFDKSVVRFCDGAFCNGNVVPLNSFYIRDGIITEKIEKGTDYTCDYEEKWWDFEVIGNIYENPDLLNQ